MNQSQELGSQKAFTEKLTARKKKEFLLLLKDPYGGEKSPGRAVTGRVAIHFC